MTKLKPLRPDDRKYLNRILEAEKILRDPKKVCRFAMAMDRNGHSTSPFRTRYTPYGVRRLDREMPTRWCMLGALAATGANIFDSLYGQPMFGKNSLRFFHDSEFGDHESAMFLGFVRLFAEDVIRSRP